MNSPATSPPAKGGLNEDGGEVADDVRDISERSLAILREGRYKEAEYLGLEAYEKCLRVLRSNHPATIEAQSGLSGALTCQGRVEEGASMAAKAWMKSTYELGDNHPGTLRTADVLVRVLLCQYKAEEAALLAASTVAKSKRELSHGHPDSVRSMISLSVALRAQDEIKEATQLSEVVREVSQRELGPHQTCTIRAIYELSTNFYLPNRKDEAASISEQAMQLSLGELGKEHPITLNAMVTRSRVLSLQGEHQKAAALVEDVYEMLERLQEPSYPSRLQVANIYLSYLLIYGHVDAATGLAPETPRLSRLVQDDENALEAMAIINMARLLFLENRTRDESLRVMDDALDKQRRLFGVSHSVVASSERMLAEMERTQMVKEMRPKNSIFRLFDNVT